MIESAVYFPARNRPVELQQARREHLLRLLHENEMKLRELQKGNGKEFPLSEVRA